MGDIRDTGRLMASLAMDLNRDPFAPMTYGKEGEVCC